MFRTIHELVHTLRLFPAESAPVHTPRKTNTDDYHKLFNLLAAEPISKKFSDEEAAKALYNSNEPSLLKRYFTLKSRLKERIENTLLFVNTKHLPERMASEYAAHKDMTLVRILLAAGAHEYARIKLEKLLERGEYYNLTDVALFAASQIRALCTEPGSEPSLENLSLQAFHKYDAIVSRLASQHVAELRAEGWVRRLEMLSQQETVLSAKHSELCTQAKREVGISCIESNSFLLQVAQLRLWQYAHEAESRFEEAFNAVQTLEHLYKQHPHFFDDHTRGMLTEEQLRFCLLGHLDEQSQVIIKKYSDKQQDFMRCVEYAFLTALHAAKYERAFTLFHHVLTNEARSALEQSPKSLERWRIYEITLRYVLHDKRDTASTLLSSKFTSRSFVRPSFSATMPPHSLPLTTTTLDSSGTNNQNFMVLVLQMLFLLDDRNYEELRTKEAEISAYHDEYLRKDDITYRMQCFVRMLLHAVRTNFDYSETRRKTDKYLRWMREARTIDIVRAARMADMQASIEPLPYEHIWFIMLDRMNTKHVSTLTPVVQVSIEYEQLLEKL